MGTFVNFLFVSQRSEASRLWDKKAGFYSDETW